jgi:hypothetical protein
VGTRVLFCVDFCEISESKEVPDSYVFGVEILLKRISSGIWKILMVENPFPYLFLLDSCCFLSASQRQVSYVVLHHYSGHSYNPPCSVRLVGVHTVLLFSNNLHSMNYCQVSHSCGSPEMVF